MKFYIFCLFTLLQIRYNTNECLFVFITALLTFQVLSQSKTIPNNDSSKKRKLESPEECKIPKIIKITTKGESLEDSNAKI